MIRFYKDFLHLSPVNLGNPQKVGRFFCKQKFYESVCKLKIII